MKRIFIVGTSGSGKSFLAEQLSDRFDLPFIDLDVLYWQPKWVHCTDEIMHQKVEQLANSDRWVTSGNYGSFHAPLWSRADCVVWLDFSFHTIFFRVLLRSLERAWDKKDLWYEGSGCKESFFKTFSTKDSIVWWMIKTYASNKKRYNERFYCDDFMSRPQSPRLFHIKNSKDTFGEFLRLVSSSKI